MTLQDRIAFIDLLIQENPDATIKDYLDQLGHVQKVVVIKDPIAPAVKQKNSKSGASKYCKTYHLRL